MDHRQLLRTIAAGRIVLGVALIVLPGTTARRWIGTSSSAPGAKVITRAVGGRDLAIGAATLSALANGRPSRHWALAGVASDAVDAAATLLAVRRIGIRRALPVFVIASASAVTAYLAADHLD